ncbi:hypothetical protein CRUP_027698, partial [Coryphaenoides rupestris]
MVSTLEVQMVESSSSRTASTPCPPPNPRLPAVHKTNRQFLSSRSKRFPITAGTPSPPPPPPPPQSPSQYTHFSCAEDVIRAGVRSPPDIAGVIRSNPHLGFLYLMSAVPKSSVDYDPFNLKYVEFHGPDFVALDRWEHEYHMHRRLRSIATIALFPKWKAFRVWHRNSLRPALMDIREMCHRLSDLCLCRVEPERTYTLQEFLEVQRQQLQEVSARLEEFRQLVKDVAIQHNTAFILTTVLAATPVHSFVRLIDYLVVHTMYTLMRNSLARLLTVFQEQVGQTPGQAAIRSWGRRGTTAAAPSEDVTAEVEAEEHQEEVVEEEALEEVVEEKTCGDGPCLETILDDDNHLQSIIQNIKQSLQVAFDSANVYSCTFEHFRNFYKENESLDLDELRTRDHGAVPDFITVIIITITVIVFIFMHIHVQFFEKSLKKYHSQYRQALAIEQQRQLGLLLMLDAIVSEAEDAKFRLDLVPSATTEFVNSLTFLDEIQERVTVLEEQQETVCQMYGLMETYAVPAPAEDFALYATLRASVAAMQSAVDRSVEERDANVDRFCGCLRKDIVELNQEVKTVKQKAQDCQILDIDADASKVRRLLAEIQISIDELQGQAFTYTSYQKKIQVEVTGFDALDELSAEVKLKRLLWDSLEQWDSIHDSWMQSAFDQLDPEQLSAQVNKYSKSVSQLEKGLPPNSAVPRLKGNVDAMRDKLPVITDLHNPCLKPRHWEALERVVDASLTDEPLSLTVLERLDVFSHAAEIQEVSGQASGEASLETIIKKVEDLWWATEFTVLSHRDAKDVFILGGTDDIQEEWLTCQRSWLYLESIFSAPDIHRELAAESKMFQQTLSGGSAPPPPPPPPPPPSICGPGGETSAGARANSSRATESKHLRRWGCTAWGFRVWARISKSSSLDRKSLKRENPQLNEDVVLIRALRDANLPKFLADDAVIQLYDTMLVRHGVMLVGPTGGGKTTVYSVLADALEALHAAGHGAHNPFYRPVKTQAGDAHRWIVSDGPVDALTLNTVLDDNKMLCLASSGEIMKLTDMCVAPRARATLVERLHDTWDSGRLEAPWEEVVGTSSARTQEIIESKLEKKRKNLLGAPTNKQLVVFVDDLNMPKLDRYGSQPPIELLRQFQDFSGFYDREKFFWKEIQDMVIAAACAPPGGGRNPAILSGFLSDFPQAVRSCADGIVSAAVEIYRRLSVELLPTPAKSHYVFNLRDLSKCVQ